MLIIKIIKFCIRMFMLTLMLRLVRRTPLVIVGYILISVIFLGLISWVKFSRWLGYALILIFLGGIIVVFLYASILSSNDKLVTKYSNIPQVLLLGLISINYSIEINNPGITSCYSFKIRGIMVFIIIYLLIVLFLVVKFSEPFKGSLVKKF